MKRIEELDAFARILSRKLAGNIVRGSSLARGPGQGSIRNANANVAFGEKGQ